MSDRQHASLPIEVRKAIWRRLWRERLLRPRLPDAELRRDPPSAAPSCPHPEERRED